MKKAFSVFMLAAGLLIIAGCGGGGGGAGGIAAALNETSRFGYLSVRAVYPESMAAVMRSSGSLETTVATIYKITLLDEEEGSCPCGAPMLSSHLEGQDLPYGESFIKGNRRYSFAGMGAFDHADGTGLIKCLAGESLTLVLAMKDSAGVTQQLGITPGISVTAGATNDQDSVEVYDKASVPSEVLGNMGVLPGEIDVLDAMIIPQIVTQRISMPSVISAIIPDYSRFEGVIVSSTTYDMWSQSPSLLLSIGGNAVTQYTANEDTEYLLDVAGSSTYPGLGTLSYVIDGDTVAGTGSSTSGSYSIGDTVTLNFTDPGTYVLTVTLTGYENDGSTVNHTVQKSVTFTVNEYNSINGYVTDSQAGGYIEGAGVFLFASSGAGAGVTVPCIMSDGVTTYECTVEGADYGTATDATGFYEFAGIPDDTYEILVIRDNYEYSRTPGVVMQ